MLKALFRKQLKELFSRFTQRGGKPLSRGRLILFLLLYVYAFGMLVVVFGMMASGLCGPLTEAGLDWLYFALMALMATAFGVVGSVFSAYTSIYRAKDNDLLLAMPIPPSALIFVRLTGVALLGLLFEAMVFIPAIVIYQITVGFSPAVLLSGVLNLLVIACLVTALTCLLGWLIALVSGYVRNKTAVTMVLSLAFIGAYFYVYSSAYRLLASILASAEQIGGAVRSWLLPYYAIGRSSAGNLLWLPVSLLIGAALLGLTLFILSKTFLRLATADRGAVKRRSSDLKRGISAPPCFSRNSNALRPAPATCSTAASDSS